MKPPKIFKISRDPGYSLCLACNLWRINNRFFHEGKYWILCNFDYADYWENTDELQEDYKGF